MDRLFTRKPATNQSLTLQGVSFDTRSMDLGEDPTNDRDLSFARIGDSFPSGYIGHNNSKSYEDFDELLKQLLVVIQEIHKAENQLSCFDEACILIVRGLQIVQNIHGNQAAWVGLLFELLDYTSEMEKFRDELQLKAATADRDPRNSLEQYIRAIFDVFEYASMPSTHDQAEDWVIVELPGVAQEQEDELIQLRQKLAHAWQSYSAAMATSFFPTPDPNEAQSNDRDETLSMPPCPAPILNKGNILSFGFFDDDETESINCDDDVIASNMGLFYGDEVDVCEEGTRTQVLNTIRTWAADVDTPEQILWLNEAGGTGKTTIAATMAKEWQLNGRLAGRIFFSSNARVAERTDELCLAIAQEIKLNHHAVRREIDRAIRKLPPDHRFHFDMQFQKLVIEPLQKLQVKGPIYLVIDALDHCADKEQRTVLLKTFLRHLPSIPHLKVFLTSRPLDDISMLLKDSQLALNVENRLMDTSNSLDSDIALYVEKKLEDIPEVTADQRKAIVSRSGGLFLYAATFCRILEKSPRPPEMLEVLLAANFPPQVESQMNELYHLVLKQASMGDAAEGPMMDILSTIVVAFEPLFIETIHALLPEHSRINDIVHDLAGVLSIGGPDQSIKVIHPTFREFLLLNQHQATSFQINPRKAHSMLALACISVLDPALRYNILHVEQSYNVDSIGKLLEEHTTAAVRYASTYWAHHAAESDLPEELWTKVLTFLGEKFLNWVELMSWRSSISTCIENLSRLQTNARQNLINNPYSIMALDLLVLQHAHQFVVRHQSLLSKSPLQAYSMALFFTPRDSPIFDHYRSQYQPRLPSISTSNLVQWGSYMTLGSHRTYVEQLSFSADGSRAMIRDGDGVLYIWDTNTGALVAAPTGEKKFAIPGIIGATDCTFSRDGKLFAFATFQWQLHIRYAHSGEEAIPPLIHCRSDGAMVYCYVALSSTRAAFSDGLTVWMLDLRSGEEMQPLNIGKECGLEAMYEEGLQALYLSLSPDGQRLVFVGKYSHTDSAIVWNLETLEVVTCIGMNAASITYPTKASFSKDSTRLVLAPYYGATKLYHSSNMNEIATILDECNFSGEKVMEFCPRHLYVAAACDSNSMIGLWDKESGVKVATLQGHESGVLLVSFSQDGQRLASVSKDQTVRVWSIPTGEPLESILTGYTGHIRRCALSDDWTRLLVATEGHELRLYDTSEDHVAEGTRGRYAEPNGQHRTVAASISGKFIARDLFSAMRLWDMKTGGNLGTLAYESHTIASIAISHDDRLIAASFWSTSQILIWDLETKERVKELSHSQQGANGLVFSPDTRFLVATELISTCMWDLGTCKVVYESEDTLVAWSPDSTKFACIRNGTPYVRNIASGVELVAPLGNCYDALGTFDPSGNLLAIASLSSIYLLQNHEDGLQLKLKISTWTLECRFPRHRWLSFSSDGHYLALGQRCWDITTVSATECTGSAPPGSFSSRESRHPFIYCEDGCVHSGFPPAPLFPIPNEIKVSDDYTSWYAHNETLVLWTEFGEPVVIDCGPLLSKVRRGRPQVSLA